MRELAVQAANATASNDLSSIDLEYQQLASENTRVLSATKFNGTALLTGGTTLTFQIGANNVALEDRLDVVTGSIALTPGDVTSQVNAQNAIAQLDTDIGSVATLRATFGSIQSRFESVISNLQIASENQTAARSRIMDTDFAAETSALTRAQILQQAGTAMLAQANQMPNNVLTLLR